MQKSNFLEHNKFFKIIECNLGMLQKSLRLAR